MLDQIKKFLTRSNKVGPDQFTGPKAKTRREIIFEIMSDGKWRTLKSIREQTIYLDSSISSQLRDFRKDKFGGHTLEKRHLGDMLWEYKLIVNEGI